ncbi:unnamed protein product [Ostreobium quekettii]|uniref:Nucleolar GTP-binding protein 1 n=1 Tax=Ostreobium quekettii TaxID=121088 RepID=A0A8S1IKU9_9CHLO|nr:unnamed protein product [Ostreobium quekettii]|eukprot:evm.model.scf_7.24 EVM.evm.TU.scf_7.24   scf_7:188487-195554(+)
MPLYNFKQMHVVPSAAAFIDIVLSRTQRQTPTVCRSGWKISRVRQFYMRKVKHTQQTWHEALTQILEDFPRVDDIHPFYGDLLNVLYDKDHYKLALGQLNVARSLIDKLAQDYIRLLKYGDSLYRCKCLKRAALGRMVTLMKRQAASLKYLEQVRQHMSRLPSVDPNVRTLLMCGYPNVGKSSFMNLVTRADVEVEPYAFTTKSLYVGHMDYRYLRWQVIDTPGLLDRPLEDRNTIEMQSITALAHLRAAILYIVDISEECGYSIAQQAALFHSIKPLFVNKPVLIVCNKIDVTSMESLGEKDQKILTEMAKEAGRLGLSGAFLEHSADGYKGSLLSMTTLKEDGVMAVRNTACDQLLEHRVEAKMKGKRFGDVLNRIRVAMPNSGINPDRPPVIPSSVTQAQAMDEDNQKKTEKDLQEERGGAGVYSADFHKHYLLENDSWKYDIMPEIWDGHNIIDFVDADIDAKLEELQQEEEELLAKFERQRAQFGGIPELTAEERSLLEDIRARKAKIIADHRRAKAVADNRGVIPKKHNTDGSLNTSGMRRSLERMGMDPSLAVERARRQSRGRSADRSRNASSRAAGAEDEEMEDVPEAMKRVHSTKSRSMSRGRSLSLMAPKKGSGLKDVAIKNKALKMADRAQRRMNKLARRGEADRHIPCLRPKHLLTGTRGIGKNQRR